jgi:hypothetical protein
MAPTPKQKKLNARIRKLKQLVELRIKAQRLRLKEGRCPRHGHWLTYVGVQRAACPRATCDFEVYVPYDSALGRKMRQDQINAAAAKQDYVTTKGRLRALGKATAKLRKELGL